MTGLERKVALALGLVAADLSRLVQKVDTIQADMRRLERWQTTMDTILKRMQENN